MMNIIRKQFLENVAQTSPSPLMVEVERAEGIYLITPEGEKIVDLVSGVSVSNVGHHHPKVVAAVVNQVTKYMHTMVYGETVLRPQVEYATALARNLGEGLDSVYFLNSGSEAIEGAMKLVKRHTGRTEIVSMKNAYHGSTHGALSIQGAEDFKTAFRPLLPDCKQIRFNCFEDLNEITGRTAAVFTEIVQGESGVNLPDGEWLLALRRRCDEVGAMLVVDEIQTGFGRMGTMFAFQKWGVRPDVVCLAKALGGGMPLGAFVSSREIMLDLTHSPVLGHITTFGGHPVCCAAGLAALMVIEEDGLCENAAMMGDVFERKLSGHTFVKEIRRSGLLMAVELGSSDRLFAVMDRLIENGYMSDWFLFCDTAFRISPPLVINEREVEKTCEDIWKVLSEAEQLFA